MKAVGIFVNKENTFPKILLFLLNVAPILQFLILHSEIE